MNKADSNRIHAKRRLKERFGIVLTTRGYWELVRFILSGKAVFVPSKQKPGLSMWHLNVNGHDVVAIFDAETDTIVTFLTPEMAAVSSRVTEMP